MTMNLSFLGAAGTVTRSKYLVENGSSRVLVDHELFQGFKPLRLKNWDRFPVDPRSMAAVVLTVLHIPNQIDVTNLLSNAVREIQA